MGDSSPYEYASGILGGTSVAPVVGVEPKPSDTSSIFEIGIADSVPGSVDIPYDCQLGVSRT